MKAKNPKHMDNLKPFKKGHDERRNLDGAPKKIPNLDAHIADILGGVNDDAAGLIKILKAMYDEAVGGDIRAAEALLDRAYGKSKQTIDQTVTNNELVVTVKKMGK